MIKKDRQKKPSFQELLPTNANEADYEKLAEHLSKLIDEAELVSGIALPTMLTKNWTDLRLTWKGDDFITAVRNPEIWEKAKKGAEEAKGFI